MCRDATDNNTDNNGAGSGRARADTHLDDNHDYGCEAEAGHERERAAQHGLGRCGNVAHRDRHARSRNRSLRSRSHSFLEGSSRRKEASQEVPINTQPHQLTQRRVGQARERGRAHGSPHPGFFISAILIP